MTGRRGVLVRLLSWWRGRRAPRWRTFGEHMIFRHLTEQELKDWRQDRAAHARAVAREVDRRIESSRGDVDVPDDWLQPRRPFSVR